MSQITIYLEERVEQRVRRRAKAEGVSVSKWISQAVQSADADTWPPEVLAVLGSWKDAPEVKAIRSSYGKDLRRERLD